MHEHIISLIPHFTPTRDSKVEGWHNEWPQPAPRLEFSFMWCMQSPDQVWCGPEPAGVTMEPSTHGDVEPSEPGDMGRHQTRHHLSISSFLEVFRQYLWSNILEKATQGIQKKQCSKLQWIYYLQLLSSTSSAFLMWIMDSNRSGIKASQRGSQQAQSINENVWEGFFQWKLSLHGEGDSTHRRTKKNYKTPSRMR